VELPGGESNTPTRSEASVQSKHEPNVLVESCDEIERCAAQCRGGRGRYEVPRVHFKALDL
jgi:hypothetical protein